MIGAHSLLGMQGVSLPALIPIDKKESKGLGNLFWKTGFSGG